MEYIIFGLMILLSLNGVICENRLSLLDNDDDSVCGEQKVAAVKLLRSGETTFPGQWPWHAAIFHKIEVAKTEYRCGGIIITKRAVLTTAHCVVVSSGTVPAQSVLVKLGLNKLDTSNAEVQVQEIAKIKVHDSFIHSEHTYDIALLFTKLSITFTDYVQPSCIYDTAPGGQTVGHVVGWGLNKNRKMSDTLQEIEMPTVDHFECIQREPELWATIGSGTFCAGRRNGSTLGEGSSGGGIYRQEGNKWYAIGILSFFSIDINGEYSKSGYVGFTDIETFKNWIQCSIKKCENISRKKCAEYEMITKPESQNSHLAIIGSTIEDEHFWVCSGTIISRNFIISSKLCFNDLRKLGLKPNVVKVGFKNMAVGDTNMESENTKLYKIKQIIPFPPENGSSESSVVLVEVKEKIIFNGHVVPACLETNMREAFNENSTNIIEFCLESQFRGNQMKYSTKTLTILNDNDCETMLREVELDEEEIYISKCAKQSCEIQTQLLYNSNHLFQKYSKSLYHIRAVGKIPLNISGNVSHVAAYTTIQKYIQWIEGVAWPSYRNY